jgi:hypothetical protein
MIQPPDLPTQKVTEIQLGSALKKASSTDYKAKYEEERAVVLINEQSHSVQ